MRNGWYGMGRVLSLVVVGILGVGMFGAAYAAQKVGIDFDNGTTCASSAGQIWGAGDVSTVNDFTIFMEGLDPLASIGCTFCVGERSKVSTESWVWATNAWSEQPMANSVDSPGGVAVSSSITSHWPNYKCWLVQATDFSFANPLTLPAVIGTFTWTVAAEGPIYWLIDGANTGYYTSMGVSGDFGAAGQTCPDISSTNPNKSWGDIKQLFR